MIFGVGLSARTWRVAAVSGIVLLIIGGVISAGGRLPPALTNTGEPSQDPGQTLAIRALGQLTVKMAASPAGYNREQFDKGWEMIGNCDTRQHILARDLKNVRLRSTADCTVLSGTLSEPYTGKTIHFVRGPGTSTAVQIDHVVALSDAWRTGAQRLAKPTRAQLYNDPLELLAVDGPANGDKNNNDASGWLPPNKDYDCRYVARQIAIKLKYRLWVTPAEHQAIQRVLQTCPGQVLPTSGP